MMSFNQSVFTLLCLLIVYKANLICGFDAGFIELAKARQASVDTTHYGMTVCAVCRVTLDLLQSMYSIETAHLNSKFDATTGQCDANLVQSIIKLLKSSQLKGINPWLYSNTVKSLASANTRTDLKEVFKEESHFDSESFIGGSKLILKRYQSTVDAVVQSQNYDQARKTFGQMLHTVQDFYSHSNYIELGFSTPSDVLGKRVFQKEEFASTNQRTCVSCTDSQCQATSNIDSTIQSSKKLTSGYFVPFGLNFLAKSKPKGKCSHGGSFDSTQDDEPTGGINKDKLTSIHGHLHHKAASIAYNATAKILTQLRQDIGDDSFSLFLTLKKNSNSLVIIIDTSCSIGNYIDLAKKISTDIINQYGQLEYAPHNYILITFNNQRALVVTSTTVPNDLISIIQTQISCSNYNSSLGGMYYSSLVDGLARSEYGSVIYTFTDTSASDGYLKYQARALLRNKHTVIYSFLGQQLLRLLQRRSRITSVDQQSSNDDGADLAWISGGLTYPITVNDQSVISEFVLRRLEWTRLQSLVILRSNSTSITFYVDASIDQLLVDISSTGAIANNNQFQLVTPNNTEYSLNTSLNHTLYLYMWKIPQPQVGIWRLTAASSSPIFDLNVQIQGKSPITCSSALQNDMEGNVDSSGYTELTTEPLMNSSLLILTTCENANFTTANISLINESGQIISTYSPLKIDQYDIITNVTVPTQPFRILTTLLLYDGTRVQRIERPLVSPSIFTIELINQPYIVLRDQTIQMNYTLKSLSSERVQIRLQVRDILNLIDSDNSEKNITFTSSTSGMHLFTLPKTYQGKATSNMIIFSLLTQNSTTAKVTYQNDDVALVYFDNGSSTMRVTTLFISMLLSMVFYHSRIF